MAPRTVWHFDRLLHKALRDAVRQRLIAFNHADEVEPPKVERRRPTTLTADGFLKLLKVAEGTRRYAAVVLIFTAGVRRGELLALRDQDVRLDTSQLEIVRSLSETKGKGLFFKEPKSKSSIRRITLPGSTVEVLRRHRLVLMQDRLKLGLGWSDDVLLFGTVEGNPIRPRSFTKEFCQLAKRAGLFDISPHAARHGHLTQLLELEVHPKIAQARAGHASIAVTLDIYSHVTNSMQERAAERVNAELEVALAGKVRCQGASRVPIRYIAGVGRGETRRIPCWMGGRAVEGTGLENRQGSRPSWVRIPPHPPGLRPMASKSVLLTSLSCG